MVACQFEAQVVDNSERQDDTGKVVTAILGVQHHVQEIKYHTQSRPTESTMHSTSDSVLHRTSNKLEKMEKKKRLKKKKFKPANHLYCFEVDGIFTSTKEPVTERIVRPDLDFSDVDHYLECYEPAQKSWCNELRSVKKNKLQKVHTQIRDEHFNRSKCVRVATDKKYHIKQRLVARQNIRMECVDEHVSAHKLNIEKRLKKMGIKLKGVCCPLESGTSNYHPTRLKFDEEEQRRKEPCRIKKKKIITERKKEPRRVTPFKPRAPKKLEFAEYALHKENISNAVDKQTKELIDLQYRDLTAADLDTLFKIDTEAIIKQSLDEQLNNDLAVVQKSIADAKELEEKIRNDSSRMLELMMQLQFRELSPEDYELLLRLDETVKPKLATSKAVRSLASVEVGPEHEGQCCLICMDDYVTGDMLKVLPCKHMYHTKCIEPWLTMSSNKCPLDSVEVL